MPTNVGGSIFSYKQNEGFLQKKGKHKFTKISSEG